MTNAPSPTKSTRKESSRAAAAAGLVLASALVVGLIACVPWLLMVLLGAAHADVSPAIPALGFTATVILTGLVATLGAIFNATSHQK